MPELHRYPDAARRPDDFLQAITEIVRRERVAAVLAGDDEVIARLLAFNPLSGTVVLGPTADQYRQLCDKGGLRETARAASVASPASAVVDAAGRCQEWPPLPVVVKPTATNLQLLGWSVGIVDTPERRDALVRQIIETTGTAIVEEQVSGESWRVYFVSNEDTTRFLAIRTLRSYPRAAGSSSVSVTVRQAPSALLEATSALVAAVSYRGPGSAQFIVRDGVPYVHDVNLRLPSSVGVGIRAGFDMPRLAVEAGLGGPLPPVRPRRVRYVWLEGELRATTETSAERRAAMSEIVLAAISPRRVLDHVGGPARPERGPCPREARARVTTRRRRPR